MGRSSDRTAMQRAHFNGATAVVTGAASGIGRSLAAELVDRGATVLVADIDGEAAEATAVDLPRRAGTGARAHGSALPATVDVTDAGALSQSVGRFAAEHGGLDFMFNNAGIAVGGEVRDLSLAHWRRAVDVNLMSVIHGVAAAYPLMIEQGRGHIVNLSLIHISEPTR